MAFTRRLGALQEHHIHLGLAWNREKALSKREALRICMFRKQKKRSARDLVMQKVLNNRWIFKYIQEQIQASLMTQTVKNLPALQETRVLYLGREDPPEATSWGPRTSCGCRPASRPCLRPRSSTCSDLGRAQNAGPTESVPLRTTRVPEPEQLGPGRCMQPRASLGLFPVEQPRARAVWAGRLHVP